LPVSAVPTNHGITWMHSVVVRGDREQQPPEQHHLLSEDVGLAGERSRA
jgi:hypothetical protein